MKIQVLLLTLIICTIGIVLVSLSFYKLDNQDVALELDGYVAQIEVNGISYYRNSESCKNLIYTKSDKQFWYAEPRSTACGSEIQYESFSDEASQIFNSIKNKNDANTTNTNIKVLEIKRTLLNSQLVFSIAFRDNVNRKYLYDPKHISIDDERNEKIDENWSVIPYNPSPF